VATLEDVPQFHSSPSRSLRALLAGLVLSLAALFAQPLFAQPSFAQPFFAQPHLAEPWGVASGAPSVPATALASIDRRSPAAPAPAARRAAVQRQRVLAVAAEPAPRVRAVIATALAVAIDERQRYLELCVLLW
jgi:hypothetical protein